jgi:hypothetical protein
VYIVGTYVRTVYCVYRYIIKRQFFFKKIKTAEAGEKPMVRIV